MAAHPPSVSTNSPNFVSSGSCWVCTQCHHPGQSQRCLTVLMTIVTSGLHNSGLASSWTLCPWSSSPWAQQSSQVSVHPSAYSPVCIPTLCLLCYRKMSRSLLNSRQAALPSSTKSFLCQGHHTGQTWFPIINSCHLLPITLWFLVTVLKTFSKYVRVKTSLSGFMVSFVISTGKKPKLRNSNFIHRKYWCANDLLCQQNMS